MTNSKNSEEKTIKKNEVLNKGGHGVDFQKSNPYPIQIQIQIFGSDLKSKSIFFVKTIWISINPNPNIWIGSKIQIHIFYKFI